MNRRFRWMGLLIAISMIGTMFLSTRGKCPALAQEAQPAAGPSIVPASPAPPLPHDCDGITPPGEPPPACCAWGYVYHDGAPVAGASVTVQSASGSLDTTTADGSISSRPYYHVNLSAAPLSVSVGEIITVTAAYHGANKSVVYQVVNGGQQVDVVLPDSSASTLEITEVSPVRGTDNLTTTLTLLGGEFSTTGAPTVTLGSIPLVNVNVLSSTVLVADVPMSTTLGAYDVTVTNPGGESGSLTGAFSVVDFDATTVDVDYYVINDDPFSLYDILIDATGDHDLWGVMGYDDTRIYKLDLSKAAPGTSNGLEIYLEPHDGGKLMSLAQDNDGHLCWTQEWLREAGGGRIGCLTMTQVVSGTTTGVAEFPVTGDWRDTDGITFDSTTNSFWFSQRNDDEIVRLVFSETVPDTSNGLHDHNLPGGASWPNQKSPQQMVSDGQGNIWILGVKSVGGSGVYDTQLWKLVLAEASPGTSNGFYSHPLPDYDPNYGTYNMDSIKVAPDGNLWATTDGHLYKIVPAETVPGTSQGIYVYHIPSQKGEQPEDKYLGEIQFGEDGLVWFVADAVNKIVSFDPSRAIAGTSRGFTEYPAPLDIHDRGKTAGDGADNLYFTAILTDDTRVVARFTTSTFQVAQVNPLNAGHNAVADTLISATFNKPVEFTTVSTRTFTVRGAQTGIYLGSYTAGSVQFDPAQNLKPGEEIVVNLGSGIESTGGITLTPYAWSFRAAPLGGSGVFTDTLSFGTGSDYSQAIEFGDVDGDGDLDLVVGGGHWTQNVIYLNDGHGDFSTGRNFGSGSENTASLALGDFDNDGDLDIAQGNWDDQNDVYLNDGDGNFTFKMHFDVVGYTYSIATADVDGDGDLDLIVANRNNQSAVYLNDGAANFSQGDDLGASDWRGRGLAVGDMDGDGDLDIVLGHQGTERLPHLFLNGGAGHFPISRTIGTNPATTIASTLGLGDVDNDGDLDLALGNVKEEPSFILLNDGLGNFPVTCTFQAGGSDVYDLAFGDVDGDGDLDLVASSGVWDGHQSKLHYNNGSCNFTFSNLGGQTRTAAVLLGDVDQDGDLDIAAGRYMEQNIVYINDGHPSAPLPPIATVYSLTPNPATQGQDTVTFRGSGQDQDENGESIVAYRWRSSLDGLLSAQAEFAIAASSLTTGTHTIYFKVQDDEGVWSDEIPVTLIVREPAITWTFLLYLDGDNNLHYWLQSALDRLESTAFEADVTVLALFDDYGNGHTWRYHVQHGGGYTDELDRWDMGELNMGHPQTLSNFITWGRNNYPADHYYLAVADHGRGTTGIAWDEADSSDLITVAELRTALQDATDDGAQPIDIVHYDACLMGMLENAYQIKDFADYLVASENLGWGIFAYSSYAAQITVDTTPWQLATAVVDKYHDALAKYEYPHTIAALYLAQVEAVENAVTALAIALQANLEANKYHVYNAREATQKFDSRNYFTIDNDDEYLDLYDLARLIEQNVPDDDVKNAAQGVMDAVMVFVIAEQHTSGHYRDYDDWNLENAHGVAIYFPPATGGWGYDDYVNHTSFDFTADSQWDEFLQDYYRLIDLPPDPLIDPGIPPVLEKSFSVYLPVVSK